MYIAIVIYLASIIGYWLFTHYMCKEAEPLDIVLMIVPIINTTMCLLGVFIFILELIIKINWQKVANKVFKI